MAELTTEPSIVVYDRALPKHREIWLSRLTDLQWTIIGITQPYEQVNLDVQCDSVSCFRSDTGAQTILIVNELGEAWFEDETEDSNSWLIYSNPETLPWVCPLEDFMAAKVDDQYQYFKADDSL